MMFFLTLYCGRAEILIEDVSSVILLNTVHFPNWNMTLSQKIALNLCHFFLPVFVSFFVISLSIRKYWLRELWIKKKDWGFFFPFWNHAVGSQSFHCLEPCFMHFPAQISGTFSDFCGLAFGSWAFQSFLGIHGPLSSPGLCSWSWADLHRDKEVQASTCRTQKSCPQQNVAGARGGNLEVALRKFSVVLVARVPRPASNARCLHQHDAGLERSRSSVLRAPLREKSLDWSAITCFIPNALNLGFFRTCQKEFWSWKRESLFLLLEDATSCSHIPKNKTSCALNWYYFPDWKHCRLFLERTRKWLS